MTLKWLPNAVSQGTQRSHPVQPPSTTQPLSTTTSASMTEPTTVDSQFEQLVALAKEIVAIGSALRDDDTSGHGRRGNGPGMLHNDPIMIRRHVVKLIKSGQRLLDGLDEEKGGLGHERFEVVAAARAKCVNVINSYPLVTNNRYAPIIVKVSRNL